MVVASLWFILDEREQYRFGARLLQDLFDPRDDLWMAGSQVFLFPYVSLEIV